MGIPITRSSGGRLGDGISAFNNLGNGGRLFNVGISTYTEGGVVVRVNRCCHPFTTSLGNPKLGGDGGEETITGGD
jgi:hypothetical protein